MGPEWIAASRKKHDEAVANGDAERSDLLNRSAVSDSCSTARSSRCANRALVMISNDISENAPNALRSHVQVGLYAGITRDEIREIVFMMTQYCGHPRAREADITISALFAELDITISALFAELDAKK